ncbi:protein-glutamine gamma-glutamyltransferase 4 [Dipodomys spectabilis]|uniref:protein-glutamine gamma-glutamyltransferase 4 n=1 Tax=Dipodomys spectabilis TaxID=105255 RepID=UPI001C54BDC2|nr:protein-glutamine gamma-glutamyltransferase 4 [Dipodomys spectabilis]
MNELQALRIDFLRKQNTTAHHTDNFQTNKLVLRRGQVFHLRLILSKSLEPHEQLKLQFAIGPNPSIAKHTLVELNLKMPTASRFEGWKASLTSNTGKEVIVAITSAPNSIVGKYEMAVKTGSHTFRVHEDFYLLFNPWCIDDPVFLPDEEERKEYILNDTGYIYMGFAKHIRGKPWNFGQFEKNILSCAIYLLTQSYLKILEMRDPVLVARTMCAMMSAANSNGVLTGNWSGNYAGGTAPHLWSSSVAILQQFHTTKQPVNFGQCWVFSGILTTVLRALGIPARSVTAFESAHDTEKDLTVDIYLNQTGKTIPDLTKDSVWNFHVWTDAWMRRPDLPVGNDGWQALDGTPQEISHGIFRCGPSPLPAIRNGDIFLGYDTKFIFTEVNGDKLIWLLKKVGGEDVYSLIAVETDSIGKNISTKAVGQDRRHDITYQYKYPEGSAEEREAMNHAYSLLQVPRPPQDLHKRSLLGLSIMEETVELGRPVVMTVLLRRTTEETRRVSFSASINLQTYTGKNVAQLAVVNKEEVVEGEEAQVVFIVSPDTYIPKLGMVDDEVVVKIILLAQDLKSEESTGTDDTLHFVYSNFFVEMPDTGKVGQELTCVCRFRNVLPIPLTHITFSLESLAISSTQTVDKGMLPAGEAIQFQIQCIPVKSGPKKFIFKFTSREVKGIHAEKMALIS